MSYEQQVGLEPLPDGTFVALHNPYTKTIGFQIHCDDGVFNCWPFAGYVLPEGYSFALKGYEG